MRAYIFALPLLLFLFLFSFLFQKGKKREDSRVCLLVHCLYLQHILLHLGGIYIICSEEKY